MLDPKWLRKEIDVVAAALKRRGFDLNIEEFNRLESSRKSLQVETEELQNLRKKFSKMIGEAKASGDEHAAAKWAEEVGLLKERLQKVEQEFQTIQEGQLAFMQSLPNVAQEDVPQGKDESENVEIRRWGEPRSFDFEPKDHVALGEQLGQMDFETAAKLSGARFVVLKGQLARLQRALIQFMLDMHVTEHGYEEIYVPYLVNRESLFGTGQLPKFAEDLFHVQDHGLSLISTAEIPVTNTVRDQIVEGNQLPIQYACHSPCFRSEAGSYGRDTRGMIRQHQFEKVELVWLTKPEQSHEAHEKLTAHAEAVLKRLELPYRVVVLCTGDLGFSSSKTYDLEVWLPGQNAYREISSCSNMHDFQARNMQARYRDDNGKPQLMHTLNGSGLAVGRTLLAVMENYQEADGSIRIPDALKSYLPQGFGPLE